MTEPKVDKNFPHDLTDEDHALEDFTKRLTDALNRIEPFAARFHTEGTRVYMEAGSALQLLGWIRRYNERTEAGLK